MPYASFLIHQQRRSNWRISGGQASILVTSAGTYICLMCGRFTHRYTWADIHRLYRLTSPASNVQPSYPPDSPYPGRIYGRVYGEQG